MTKLSLNILRFGLSITFLWIGILIWQDPVGWGGYLKPWVLGFLPIPLKEAMLGTAALDLSIGTFFLINRFTWLAAAAGSAHLIIVLITSGINDITVRDIGLLAATFYMAAETWPEKYKFWIKK